MNTPTRPRSAFTLIELLTVIAIIGILAAILIPVVGSVRESARGAKCSSNMRQIGQGLLMYASENGGRGPAGRDDTRHEESGGGAGSTSLASTFHYAVWPYVHESLDTLIHDGYVNTIIGLSSTENVFLCPTRYSSYPVASSAPAEIFFSGTSESFGSARYHYAINTMAAPNRNSRLEVPIDSMTTPSRTVAIVESYYWYEQESYYFGRFGVVPHGDGANFLFYDGHVERVNRSAIPPKSEARDSVFWSGDNAT